MKVINSFRKNGLFKEDEGRYFSEIEITKSKPKSLKNVKGSFLKNEIPSGGGSASCAHVRPKIKNQINEEIINELHLGKDLIFEEKIEDINELHVESSDNENNISSENITINIGI